MNGYNEKERDEQLGEVSEESTGGQACEVSEESTGGQACDVSEESNGGQACDENVKKQKYISENDTYGGKPTTLKGKLENFWYHHKWATIVSCLVVIILTTLVINFATRPDYDFYVLYAGGHKISGIQDGGKASERENILSSLGRIGSDFDENGEISAAIIDIYYLTDEEINELEASGKGNSIDYQQLSDAKNSTRDKLKDTIITGDVCLLFISESIFDELYDESAFSNGALFYPLSALLAQSKAEGYEFYGDSDKAVKLHSLKFSELPGICELPEDTVVCLRVENKVWFNSNADEFLNAKATIKKLFNYGY